MYELVKAIQINLQYTISDLCTRIEVVIAIRIKTRSKTNRILCQPITKIPVWLPAICEFTDTWNFDITANIKLENRSTARKTLCHRKTEGRIYHLFPAHQRSWNFGTQNAATSRRHTGTKNPSTCNNSGTDTCALVYSCAYVISFAYMFVYVHTHHFVVSMHMRVASAYFWLACACAHRYIFNILYECENP